MSGTQREYRVTIVIKALPQPSSKHGETVCCAGLTAEGEWKRLYPVRFRHLSGDASFKRWDWVKFRCTRPTSDRRDESCKIFEDTIRLEGNLRKESRGALLNRVLQPSIEAAAERGRSLAAIRPTNTRFSFRKKSAIEVQNETHAYAVCARQTSLFDAELKALEPSPYEFSFAFSDNRAHNFRCGDWEVHAMFYRERLRTSETQALQWLDQTFNQVYPAAGMIFAVGNMASRPQTWQLLGVLKVDGLDQPAFI